MSTAIKKTKDMRVYVFNFFFLQNRAQSRDPESREIERQQHQHQHQQQHQREEKGDVDSGVDSIGERSVGERGEAGQEKTKKEINKPTELQGSFFAVVDDYNWSGWYTF